MPVLPGAEPFRQPGGETGVLVCHGFTGSPSPYGHGPSISPPAG